MADEQREPESSRERCRRCGGPVCVVLSGMGKSVPLCRKCWNKAIEEVPKRAGAMAKKRKAEKAKAAQTTALTCPGCGATLPEGTTVRELCRSCKTEAEQAAKGKAAEKAKPAGTPGHISDDLAGGIFERLDAVKNARREFEEATEERKACRDDLDKAQAALEQALEDARSGQTRLFAPAEQQA